ncbi:MAG: hypothetical protein RCG16_02145 [Rickettsia hoogstraalii]
MCAGKNFYSSLSINKDASHLAYICWDHPLMPWDGTELWIKNLNAKNSKDKFIAGNDQESIAEIFWSNTGELFSFLIKQAGTTFISIATIKLASYFRMRETYQEPSGN